MNNKRVILFFAVVISLSLNAQDVSLKWSKKNKSRRKTTIIGGEKGKYHTLTGASKRELIGRVYDSNMKLIVDKTVQFNLSDKEYLHKGSFFIDGKPLHFVQDNVRKRGKASIYGVFTDTNFNASPKNVVLDETENLKNTLNFGLRSISPDSTKVMVFHEIPGKKKKPTQIVYKVFNSTLTKIVNEGKATIPLKNKNYTTNMAKVDNFGNVYMLSEIIKERKEKKKGFSKYYCKVFIFGKNKSVKEIKFDYEGKNITYFSLFGNKENKMLCAGFLNELKGGKKKKSVSDEMFVTEIDCNTLETIATKKVKLDGLYPKRVNKKDAISYKIREVFKKDNGGYSIVAEQFKLDVKYSQNGAMYYYYYCDIACIQMDKSLNITSITKVPKYQLNASSPSIVSTFKDNKTFLFYEDVAANLSAVTDKDLKKCGVSFLSSRNKNAFFMLTIDSNGKPNKQIIYKYKDSKIKLSVFDSLRINDGTILLSAKDQIGLLEIK